MAERDTHAMVSAGWWPNTPPQHRQNLVAGRMLALPDGSWWVFGAWGRWYRWTPRSGQWHLCPPPRLNITRMSARPLRPGMPVPPIPPHVVPTGPDLGYSPPPAAAFVDTSIRPEVTSRVRATVESAAALPLPDYPHWWNLFSSSTPSSVVVAWGVMLWSAAAPVFDARLDSQLLGLWSPYRARPLPDIDGPRWLTPPPLETIIGLYAERLRAGRVDAAVVILRTMWAMASALRDDPRFQVRADALIAMLGATLNNPTIDYGALPYGDGAVVQQWLTRCPPGLAPALRGEASAGEHFRNAYYDLAMAVTPVAGDPSKPGYVEPRLIAASLLSADLAVVRQEVSTQVIGWLDPEVGAAMQSMLSQHDHPLRRFWPEDNRLPRALRENLESAEPSVRDTLLATMYAADLSWCRLGGGIPARPRGFPASVAILAEILGPRRATSASPTEPVTPSPGVASPAHHYPADPRAAAPSVPPMAHQPPTGPPGQAPAWAAPAAPPSTEAWDGATGLPTPQRASAPPSTEAWDGASGLSGPRPQPGPQRTEAWDGASGLSGARPQPGPARTEAWDGAGEVSGARPQGAGPPRTEAWSPGDPVAPRTEAWDGASDAAAPPARQNVPPRTEAWSPGDPTGPGQQPWHGTPDRQDGTAGPAGPPRTEAWVPEGAGGPVGPPRDEAWVPGDAGQPQGGPGRPDGSAGPPRTEAWVPGDVGEPQGGAGRPGGPAGPPRTEAWVAGESGTPGAPPKTEAWVPHESGVPAWNPASPPKTEAWSAGEGVASPPGTGAGESGASSRAEGVVASQGGAGKDRQVASSSSPRSPSRDDAVTSSRSEGWGEETVASSRSEGWGEENLRSEGRSEGGSASDGWGEAGGSPSRSGGWGGTGESTGSRARPRAEGWTGPEEAVTPAPPPRGESWGFDTGQEHETSTGWDEDPEDDATHPHDTHAEAEWDDSTRLDGTDAEPALDAARPPGVHAETERDDPARLDGTDAQSASDVARAGGALGETERDDPAWLDGADADSAFDVARAGGARGEAERDDPARLDGTDAESALDAARDEPARLDGTDAQSAFDGARPGDARGQAEGDDSTLRDSGTEAAFDDATHVARSEAPLDDDATRFHDSQAEAALDDDATRMHDTEAAAALDDDATMRDSSASLRDAGGVTALDDDVAMLSSEDETERDPAARTHGTRAAIPLPAARVSDDVGDATQRHDTAAEAALGDDAARPHESRAEAALDDDATRMHDTEAGARDDDATRFHDTRAAAELDDDATMLDSSEDVTGRESGERGVDAWAEPQDKSTQPHDTAAAALDGSSVDEAGRGSGASEAVVRPAFGGATMVDSDTSRSGDSGAAQVWAAPRHQDRRTVREDATMLDSGTSQEHRPRPQDATMFDGGGNAGDDTMLDPGDAPVADQRSPQATYIDRMDGTRADGWSVPIVAPVPVRPNTPPRTKMIEQVSPNPPTPPKGPGTRIMSGAMVGGLLGAPMPERPVEQIAPPPPPAAMPAVAERFGVRFVSGADDASRLLDGLHRDASSTRTQPSPETIAARTPALLIVGAPHCGQRRLTRLIARTLAGAGAGDGSVRTADAADLRGNPVQAVAATLRRDGPPLLFERLDLAVLRAPEPTRVVETVLNAREDDIGRTGLIATCGTDSYARLSRDYPDFVAAFKVFRLPDMSDLETRLALIHVLADERRVTLTAAALDLVRADLPRMGGRDMLVGAGLVEAYLDRAVARHTDRVGAARDRLLLTPEDFAGVAEEIEPSLRPPGDVDGFVRTLHEMIGLEKVKRTVDGLVAEARMAADRSVRGLPSGNPSRHLIFLGRPGTGRTTVAGLIGGIYAALNLLDSGHLVVCNARTLAGPDAAAKVAAQVDRASGGVLLIEDAYLLDRMSAVVAELSRLMEERRDKFMVVCSSFPDEMEGFLLANPGFRAEFGAIVEFEEPTDRQLVQLFTRLAERDLYMLDEELRVELLGRFGELRRSREFAFADTVRRLFDQIVAMQSARLAGSRVNAAAVARLSVHDLPA